MDWTKDCRVATDDEEYPQGFDDLPEDEDEDDDDGYYEDDYLEIVP